MAYFEDLSRYAYLPGTVPLGIVALNVGWLSSLESFRQGTPPEDFLDALRDLCLLYRRAVTRGWHACNFEDCIEKAEPPILRKDDGNVCCLGSAEVRVIDGDGRWLIAPNMVYHYVAEHRYLPPGEFVEGVLAFRPAPE
ncbi:DUF7919 family protein [Wenjunlia vitaminophila]